MSGIKSLGSARGVIQCLFITLAVIATARPLCAEVEVAHDTSNGSRNSLLPFYLIRGWEATTSQTEHTKESQPAEFAIERLCEFFQTPYDPNSGIYTSQSPLEWPRVFASEVPNAQRQRTEIRALLEANKLAYREIVPLDLRREALADSVARSVTEDHPILLNSPDAAVVYGYDRREPDHWWWFDRAGVPEIVLESERTSQFTFWSDDQAAGISWSVTGVGAELRPRHDSLDWTFLRTIAKSVQGAPAEGVPPYPLSLRDFRDLLASTDSLPALAAPASSSDPVGVRHARAAREYLLGIIEKLGSKERDTSVSEPLHLAEYHIHSSVDALSQMAIALYGSDPSDPAVDSLSMNWSNIRQRQIATQAMTELLKSEKLALESLQSAVTAFDKLKSPLKLPSRPVTRRRRQ